ncbi:MAG: response regulator [Halobacteriota archaeon]
MTGDRSETTAPTVLVVDDETSLAKLYRAWLAESYDVSMVHDGRAALSELDEHVDAVLLDRRMPGLSGDEVLTQIRASGRDVPVAMISAVTPDFDVVGLEFDAYVVKPVTATEIREVVDRLLTYAESDEPTRTFAQLVTTKRALETKRTVEELRQNETYLSVLERIKELRSEADTTIVDCEDLEEPT